jgi:YidC/Oxa1 family membrane protein insertase
MGEQEEPQGCRPDRTTIVVLAIAGVWFVGVWLYQAWQYGRRPHPPEEPRPEAAPAEVEEARSAPAPAPGPGAPGAGEVRALARRFRASGREDVARRLEREADILEGKPPRPALAPGLARDRARAAARDVTGAMGPPGLALAEGLAEGVESLPEGGGGQVSEAPRGPPAPDAAEVPEAEERTIEVETDDLIVTFNTRGASVERAALKGFHLKPEDRDPLQIMLPLSAGGAAAYSFILRRPPEAGPDPDLANAVWELASDAGEFDAEGERRIVFSARRGTLLYTKTYALRREGFTFSLEVAARNAGDLPVGETPLDLVGPNGIVPDDVAAGRNYAGMIAVLAGRDSPGGSIDDKEYSHGSAAKSEAGMRVLSKRVNEWVAVKNRYFAAILQAEDKGSVSDLFAEPVTPSLYAADEATGREGDPRLGQPNVAAGMRLKLGPLVPGDEERVRFTAYLGPVREENLAAAGGERGWNALVSFGWLGSLSRLLLVLLNALHYLVSFLPEVIGGYGLSILLLTIGVKAALHPLQRKGLASMHKMQKLQPEMKAIQKKYEKDKSAEGKRKQQAEIMEMYKRHGVHPLGGCLPMLVQLPMFFAFYGMLRGAFELRQARYLWISDLTQPDMLVSFGTSVPLLGRGINLLPILYIGLFFLGQHLQPRSDDPQAQQQRTIMKFMMVFLFFIFWSMFAGLVLYFVFSNAIGIFEQWLIRRKLDAEEGPAPAPAAAGAPARPGPPPKTAWEKQAEKDERKRKKRQEKKKQREGMPRF